MGGVAQANERGGSWLVRSASISSTWGDCSFVVPPAGAGAVLFDCNDAHVAERFVTDHGIHHLDAAIVSHLDVDHIRGMVSFLKAFMEGGGTVKALYLGLDGPSDARSGASASALLDAAQSWEKEGKLALFAPVGRRPRRWSAPGRTGE